MNESYANNNCHNAENNERPTHLGSPITVSQMKCNAENIQIDAYIQIFP